ncbi:hypothetical protein [Clostridium hydrogeniformans]|uniref:hypothetical protein n=1 Tax=Clostridium hydrogeniformans TaxID=349933 RepID=UPI000489B1A4|nr:hypothetical protein [Clostridium hydrogeniformans]
MIKKVRKHKGSVTIKVVIGLLLFQVAVIGIWRAVYYLEGTNIQYGLQYAQLAAYSQVDKIELGNDEGYISIKSPDKALNVFKEKLIKNLSLSTDFTRKDGVFIKDKIIIKDFIIYNVRGSQVDIYTMSSNGYFNKKTESINNTKTPIGTKVENTTIHTTLSFDVDVILSTFKDKEIKLDTDIVKYENNN